MKLLIVTLFLALSLASNSQPRNIQAKLTEVKTKGHKAYCKAISMEGDSVYLRLGFSGGGKIRCLSPGIWVSIQADYSDKQKTWYCRKIKINK